MIPATTHTPPAAIRGPRTPWVAAALGAALGGWGCASINPILAPARVLPAERVAVDLGTGYSAPVAEPVLREAHEASARLAAGGSDPRDTEALTRAALLFGATPPGVGSYVAVRAGLGHGSEAHLALAGRVARVGARRVFWTDETWALSLGLQGRFALVPAATDGAVPGLHVSESRLYGGDLSMVLGRTSSELYDVWVGLRAGFVYGQGTMALAQANGGTPFGVSGGRFDASTVLGLRVGFGRLAALAEIDTTLMVGFGQTSTGFQTSGAMLALTPSAALAYSF